MSVQRIQNLNIKNRSLFTGIYGLTGSNEYYIEKNLCSYHLWQELYLYLHEEGFITIFYNINNNFFSYAERDLELFLGKIKESDNATSQGTQSSNRQSRSSRHARCRGPLGGASARRQPSSSESSENNSSQSTETRSVVEENSGSHTKLSSHYPDIITGGSPETGYFYQTKRSDARIFDRIFHYVDQHRDKKLVVVFTTPETTRVENDAVVRTELMSRSQGHGKTNMPLRILALYSAETVRALATSFTGDAFFYNQYFRNLIFPNSNNGQDINASENNLFHLSRPGMDEIGNVLNRRRIMEGMKNVFSLPFESTCRTLWQEFPMRDRSGRKIIDASTNKTRQVRYIHEMMDLELSSFESTLDKLESSGGWQKFDTLLGIDNIKSKLTAYIKAFHDFKDGKSKQFNPHIALTGNPGTGKTTIARLIGDILREEGLLSLGHFVETSPKDLIGQYVGETRVKTGEVCQQSRGGILFVDEAYGLCDEHQQGGQGPDYGREAIEALLPFMLSETKDSVVIFAGYPKEIEYFLKNGNPGLARRVPNVWNIEDYSPDILYQIGMSQIEGRETTEEFRTTLKMVFAYKYAMRSSKTWGNAGDASVIMQRISTKYIESGSTGSMGIDCIPDEYLLHVRDISQEQEDYILQELNELIGLTSVKDKLHELLNKIKVQRHMMRQTGLASPSQENLNFIFSGNPGTGKTTVAKMLGKILHGFGLLDSAEVIEADVDKVNHGDPAKNIMEYFDKAVGKVLFIDEAYSLINQNNTIAVDALTKALTDENYKGKMAIVLAGYSVDMTRLLNSNRGLTSRFPNQIHFEDYTNEELWKVLLLKAAHFKPSPLVISEECHPYAIYEFSRISREKFSNAREAENLIKKLYTKMGNRIYRQNSSDLTIMPEDFDSYGKIDPSLVKIEDGTSHKTPMEKLDGLCGIDEIKTQFAKYLKDFRYAQEHPQSVRFRPHMAFLGNPGTGKTTVARIFGDILREEHLLETGNFVEAKAEDFIAGYIGGTQEKAQAKCKEARGGIMFIDEAHHLYQGEDEHGYAKEALRVILTELESRTDTLYIFAGYTREMNEFLDKADPGMRSRVGNIFEFKDYDPKALLSIVNSKLQGATVTKNFTDMLQLAVENMYNTRNPFAFGNARDMEILASNILNNYRDLHEGQGDIDADCIPERYLGSLREITPERESAIMSEINGMVGLEQVKSVLAKITNNAKGVRRKIKIGKTKHLTPNNLTFLFMGNPGTGKTTVAQMVGKILCGYGLLPSDEVKIYSKEKIISKYVGETAKNVTRMFDESFGRVLFIDEAYMLAKDQWGKEALDQITANMTDKNYQGKMAIIMAGYTDEINNMLNSNVGLRSRFNYNVIFDDYTNDQLWQILSNNIQRKDLLIDELSCKPYADAYFNHQRQSGVNFGNVRECNKLLEALESNQNCRTGNAPDDIEDENFYITILPDDFPNYNIERLKQLTKETVSPSQDKQSHSHGISDTLNDISIDVSSSEPAKFVKEINEIDFAVGMLRSSNGEGTGFIVSVEQKLILTCSHVVENTLEMEFNMQSGSFSTQAHTLWNDYLSDMAILVVDSLPENAHHFELDNDINSNPVKLTELIMCGYPDGSAFASGVSVVGGAINNYEKERQWNDRKFDTIYANMSATHGCSGGPVIRKNDHVVVGLLQGGKEGGEIQFITDIHQLIKKIQYKK